MSDFSSDRKRFGLRTELEQVDRAHRQTLFSMAPSITGCVAGAEDSVHNAFARLLRRVGEVAVDLVSYAFAACRNSVVDIRRLHLCDRRAFGSLIVDTSVRQSGRWIAHLMTIEERLQLHRAIEQLDGDSREVVIINTDGGRMFDRIAAAPELRPSMLPLAAVAVQWKMESHAGSHHDSSGSAII
ncbi:MAG: sigma-70 family RNA polymerase sigma factor [Planctomycetota bacterium]